MSVAMQGFDFDTIKTTTMQDATQPHPDRERTVFVSHQDHSNWNGLVSTTNHDAYYAKIPERVDPVNNELQQSHASFGNPAIREVMTLYNDTFGRPPPTLSLADADASRAFHMGHHSNCRSEVSDGPARMVYQATCIHHKDAKPSDICDSLKVSHNIVANDPRVADGERPSAVPRSPHGAD
jgi:hypothetical protein